MRVKRHLSITINKQANSNMLTTNSVGYLNNNMNKCKKHPRYKGIRPPSCSCHECVMVYMDARGLDEVLNVGASMANIFFNYSQDSSRFNEMERGYLKNWAAKWDN